ncbi:MAG: hypothetical protein V7752_19365 [Halopseudomonas sp.]
MSKLFGLVSLFSLFCVEAHADDPNVTIRFGGFFGRVDSSVGAHIPDTEIGKRIDFETDLHLQSSHTTPMFELHYQWSENHSLIFNWVRLRRSGVNQVISSPFELDIGGDPVSVQAGAELFTDLKMDLFQLAYGYDFFRTDDLTATVTLGAHIFYNRAEFSGQIGAATEGHWTTLPFETVSSEVAAPLPDIGLQLRWDVTPELQLGSRLQGFALDIGKVKGHIIDLRLEMVQSINEQFGLGVAYQFYRFKVEYQYDLSGDLNSVLDFDGQYNGPMVFLQYQF